MRVAGPVRSLTDVLSDRSCCASSSSPVRFSAMPPRVRSSKPALSSGDVAAAHAEVSTRTRTRKAKAAPVSLQSSARLGLLSGLIEGTLVMMELMFGLSVSKAAMIASYKSMNGLSADDDPPPWNMFCIGVASNLVVVTWMIFRMSQKSQPVCSLKEMANRLDLWPLPRRLSRDSLLSLLRVFCLHFVGTAGMFAVQSMTGKWIFSWQNYWSEKKGWDYPTVLDMLVCAPLREELTFRGLMFAIFYLRGTAFKIAPPAAAPVAEDATAITEGDASSSDAVATTAPTDATADSAAPAAPLPENLAWTASWKLDCVIASAMTFGLVHLLNLLGARYTRTYILLQVFLGMTLGSFYCFRFILSDNSMLETIGLHMINNVFSSFLPIEEELDLSNPIVSLPLMLTFVVYGTLAYGQYKKLMSLPPHPFKVLLPTVVVPSTAVAAEAPAAAERKEE